MKCFGLIGYPLSHSFSKKYFTEKFVREGISGCSYENFPLGHIDLLPGLIAGNAGLAGLNVTIPYKEAVIPYLNGLDKVADAIGAVNTIKITRNGGEVNCQGFNTDAYGFRSSIMPHIGRGFSHALILGTGGASRAVAYVFRGMGLEVTFVSRNPAGPHRIAYSQLTPELISGVNIIVNTSPLGMYPHTDAFPCIPYGFLTPQHVLYDLIYNPEETRFLANGRKMGAITVNGLQMLHLQAEKSWEIWNTP